MMTMTMIITDKTLHICSSDDDNDNTYDDQEEEEENTDDDGDDQIAPMQEQDQNMQVTT